MIDTNAKEQEIKNMENKPIDTKAIIAAKLKSRYASENRFKYFGIGMVITAIVACGFLLLSIIGQALPALSENRLVLNAMIEPAKADPAGTKKPEDIRSQGDFSGIILDTLLKKYPEAENGTGIDVLMEMVSSIGSTDLAKQVAKDPNQIGKTIHTSLALNDDLDMFLKGGFGKTIVKNGAANLNVQGIGENNYQLSENGAFKDVRVKLLDYLDATIVENNRKLSIYQGTAKNLEAELNAATTDVLKAEINARISTNSGDLATVEGIIADAKAAKSAGSLLELTSTLPSVLLVNGENVFKINKIDENRVEAILLVKSTNVPAKIESNKWNTQFIEMPEDGRPIDDETIAYGLSLKEANMIKARPNYTLLTRSDSNDAEMAGLLSAIVGSILTLMVTLVFTVPIGVLAAIYLEEFAPKNAITDFIEVNINNLAAVPSIVFGLLGFSVFLHFFGMPRSAPLVGGIVLALMSLPVIIIASRASLKAVPPSIREAALGVGASKVQAIFHHVLPLATPGIMTGTILALAHALGETAPLLMIGMVAFIADVPKTFMDSATVLPVEIFMWAGRPERAWDARTSAAIIILLLFMIIMNITAIALRRKFERRW